MDNKHHSIRTSVLFLVMLVVIAYAAIVPHPAYSQSTYTVDTGTIARPYDRPGSAAEAYGWNGVQLARWPDGTLLTTYNKLFGSAQEIYFSYSQDGGLNFNETRLTAAGHDQGHSSICVASNYDIWIAFCGKGSVAYPTQLHVSAIHYDYSAGSWDAAEIIYNIDAGADNHGAFEPHVMVDSNDNVYIGFKFDHGTAASSRIILARKEYNGDGTWGSVTTYEITPDSTTSVASDSADWAIDQDDNVGCLFSDATTTDFALFNGSTLSWGSWEAALTKSGQAHSLMASISSGNTVWRAIGTETSTAKVYYAERNTGSWGATSEIYSNNLGEWLRACSLTQTQGTGGDTGDFYAIFGRYDSGSPYTDYYYYEKYTLGVGWGATQTIRSAREVLHCVGTKDLYPATGNWHWQLPAEGMVCTYYDQDDDTWEDGDERFKYYETSAGWGDITPVVDIISTSVTTTTITVTCDIIVTDPEATVRGVNYGFGVQVAQESETETGNFTAGEYTITLTGLESDEIYYLQATATNSEGTGTSDWYGVITAAQGSEPDQPDEPEEGMVPPVPTTGPGNWINPSKTYDTWWFSGLFNTFFDTIGRSFGWFCVMIAMVITVGMLLCGVTKHLGITFLILGIALGIFIAGNYLDWWTIFPYLLFGLALWIREQQYGWT